MKNWTAEDKTIILNVLRTLKRKNKTKKIHFASRQLIIFYGINKGLPGRKQKEDLDNSPRQNHRHDTYIQPFTIGKVCSYLNNQGLLGSLDRETGHVTWELTDNIFKEPIEGEGLNA